MRARLALVLPLALAAARVNAVELELGWSARTAWDSNVFGRSDDEESDFSGATGPQVGLRESTRAFTLGLEYRMFYEEFVDQRGLGNFEHFLTTDATWRATPRDTFSFDQSFTQSDSLLQVAETGVAGLASNRLVTDRETIQVNSVGVGYVRELAPLWQLRVDADNVNYWYEQPDSSDSRSTSGSFDVTHALSPRQRVGAGFAFTRQDFEETDFTNGSGTSFAQVFGLWTYEISETLSFVSSVGPRLAIPDDLEDTAPAPAVPLISSFLVNPTSCPQTNLPGVWKFDSSRCIPLLSAISRPVDRSSIAVRDFDFPDGRDQPDESLGFFGRLSLSKRWEHVTSTLTYERSASASSGLAASTDLDVVSLATEWRPRRDWSLGFVASWERQVSISDIPVNVLLLSPTTLYLDAQGRLVDASTPGATPIAGAAQTVGLLSDFVENAIDIRSTRVELHARHDFTTRLSLNGLVTWWRQDSKGDFQTGDPVTDTRVELTLTWRFAPIDF